MQILETILHLFINYAILLFEYVGVIVITFAGIQGIVNYIRRVPETRLILAKGLAMGLEFKLGSEILRTVEVRTLDEIYIVAAIIALRAVLTILIHWEIKNEENEEEMHTRIQREDGRPVQAAEAVEAVAAAGKEPPKTEAVPAEKPQPAISPGNAQPGNAQPGNAQPENAQPEASAGR